MSSDVACEVPAIERACTYCNSQPGDVCRGHPDFGARKLPYFHLARRKPKVDP